MKQILIEVRVHDSTDIETVDDWKEYLYNERPNQETLFGMLSKGAIAVVDHNVNDEFGMLK